MISLDVAAMIDPKYSQFFLDTCAFDPKYAPEDAAAFELWRRYEANQISLLLSHSNQRELEHPNTPQWVKAKASTMIYSLEVSLNPVEQVRLTRLEDLLRGNAKSNKHKEDAHHLFEAAKYGGIFLTTDIRILKMTEDIQSICSVRVLTPSEAIKRMAFQEES